MRLLLFCALVFALKVQAQVDPSAEVLLAPVKSSPASGLRSGRYESGDAKPTFGETKIEKTMAKPVSRAESAENTPAKVVRKRAGTRGDIPMAVIQPKIKRITASTPRRTAASEQGPPAATVDPLKPTPSPAPPSAIAATPEMPSDLLPQDRVRIDLATGVLYENAKANSVYRTFDSTSPVLALGAELWLENNMGFAGGYQTTLAADMNSSTDGASRVPFSEEWTELHWKFRNNAHPGHALWQSGLVYFEDNLRVSADETTRGNLRSAGFGADFKLGLPSSSAYNWTFGGAFYPSLQHTEAPTGLALDSGSRADSVRLDLSWGGDYGLASSQGLFWDLTLQMEKNRFGGTSSVNEPSGAPAENVSVLTSSWFLHLGYRWGR